MSKPVLVVKDLAYQAGIGLRQFPGCEQQSRSRSANVITLLWHSALLLEVGGVRAAALQDGVGKFVAESHAASWAEAAHTEGRELVAPGFRSGFGASDAGPFASRYVAAPWCPSAGLAGCSSRVELAC